MRFFVPLVILLSLCLSQTGAAQDELHRGFADPPRGYGNVPFFWWSGDSLDIRRLAWELDQLEGSGTEGFSVSYIHSHPQADSVLNRRGYGFFGRVAGDNPEVFSPAWWNVWRAFSALCAERGYGLGLDDYVIGWKGNGTYVDEVLADPRFRDYPGRLERIRLGAGQTPPGPVVWQQASGDSLDVIFTRPSPELCPGYGDLLVEKYFDRFWQNSGPDGARALNYFFQDELVYDLTLQSWCADMPEQFRQRKGYDIIPHLTDLFSSDPSGAQVRLDYAEVVTDLAGERFWDPVFDWHAERGLIYGCDNLGRGLQPTRYLDYFRATSWYTAPGNDAPARGSSYLNTKVSSSVAHLYGRPRTWLEAFHSIGWDADARLLTRQLDHHLVAGGNLLCLHGLYYSTAGGWWEWAPPCFHFRLPWWPHMKLWLQRARRLCYVLSQGSHVCDVAVLYPTETLQAFPGADPAPSFELAADLGGQGLDFDFIDFRSLRGAAFEAGRLRIADESYRVLVVAGARAIHPQTREAICAFAAAGGLVIAADCASGLLPGDAVLQTSDVQAVPGLIRSRLNPDFSTASGRGRVLHRRVDGQEVYFVTEVPEGDEMCFRATGAVERWDPMTGTVRPQAVLSSGPDGTRIRCDEHDGGSMLLVFSPGEPLLQRSRQEATVADTLTLDGPWQLTLVPTMDNRWGDFRLPASAEYIGAEAREFSWSTNGVHFSEVEECGYGPLFEGISYSARFGVKDSPGTQGYHGLKGKADLRPLILDRGGRMEFRTELYASRRGEWPVCVSGVRPDSLFVDDVAVTGDRVRLGRGWHTLRVVYNQTQAIPYSLEAMQGNTRDLRPRSDVRIGDLPMAAVHPKRMWYRFVTAPGTREMQLRVRGRIDRVLVDGKPLPARRIRRQGRTYTVELERPYFGEVLVCGRPDPDAPGAAFFETPVQLRCDEAPVEPSDWTALGALKYYSGGARYVRSFEWDGTSRGPMMLDLGEVSATCEVSVNGSEPEVLLAPPFRLDISGQLHPGENRLEVLVYSTLANHYQSVPSPYRGVPRAGLMGPVRLIFSDNQ